MNIEIPELLLEVVKMYSAKMERYVSLDEKTKEQARQEAIFIADRVASLVRIAEISCKKKPVANAENRPK